MYILFYLPVVEYRQAECLSLCVCPQVSLEPKRVNSWNECFDDVQWRARDRSILGHMTSGGERERGDLYQ